MTVVRKMPLLSPVGTTVPEPLNDKVSSGCPGGIPWTLRRLQKVEKECVRRLRVGKIQARMLGWAESQHLSAVGATQQLGTSKLP